MTWSPPALSPQVAFPTQPQAPFTFFTDLILSSFRRPRWCNTHPCLSPQGLPQHQCHPQSPPAAWDTQTGTHRPRAGARQPLGNGSLGPCWGGEGVSAGCAKATGFLLEWGCGAVCLSVCPLALVGSCSSGARSFSITPGPLGSPVPSCMGMVDDGAAVGLTQKCHPSHASDTHASSIHTRCGVAVCCPSLQRCPLSSRRQGQTPGSPVPPALVPGH